jgi:hypothetical protein
MDLCGILLALHGILSSKGVALRGGGKAQTIRIHSNPPLRVRAGEYLNLWKKFSRTRPDHVAFESQGEGNTRSPALIGRISSLSRDSGSDGGTSPAEGPTDFAFDLGSMTYTP